jgi:predicted GTPase
MPAGSKPPKAKARRRIIIAGTAGRDFHNFNMVYRNDPPVDGVAFTGNFGIGLRLRHCDEPRPAKPSSILPELGREAI